MRPPLRSTGGGPATTVLAAGGAGIGNVLFHAVASRQLSDGGYADLAAVLGVLLLGLVPIAAVQTAAARASSADPGGDAFAALAEVARVAALVAAAGVAVTPALGAVVAVDDPWALAQVGGWLGLALVGAAARGVLLGREQHRSAAASVLAGVATRLLLAAFLLGPLGLVGALVATTIGEGVALGVAIVPILATDDGGRRPFRIGGVDAALALVSQLGVWSFVASASILGRRWLPPVEADDFAVVATVLGGAAILPLAVGTAHFPRFVAAGSGRAELRAALRSAAVVGALAGVGLALLLPVAAGMLAGRAVEVGAVARAVVAALPPLIGVLGVSASWLVARRRVAAALAWLPALAGVLAAAASAPLHPTGLAVALGAGALLGAGSLLPVAWADASADLVVPPPLAPVPAGAPSCDLTVVMPSKDGGRSLRPAVLAALAVLDDLGRRGVAGELVVVADGSTDGSEQTITDLPVVLVRLAENQGKGAALRHGFAAARGERIGFIDGDGDLDARVLRDLVDALDASPSAWAAVGDRSLGASVRAEARVRRLLSRAHRLVVRLLFRLPVADTQCGAKLFDRAALVAALPGCAERGFALDLELLAVGKRLGLGAVAPVPVVLARPRGSSSTVDLRAVVRLAADVVRVRLRVGRVPAPATEEERTGAASGRRFAWR